MRYFTWNLKFFSNTFFMIVQKPMFSKIENCNLNFYQLWNFFNVDKLSRCPWQHCFNFSSTQLGLLFFFASYHVTRNISDFLCQEFILQIQEPSSANPDYFYNITYTNWRIKFLLLTSNLKQKNKKKKISSIVNSSCFLRPNDQEVTKLLVEKKLLYVKLPKHDTLTAATWSF